VIPRHFGESAPFSVGVEEELFVLDAETLQPAPVPPELLDGRRFKAELFASVLELNTGICTSVAAAGQELGELRAEGKRRAAETGLVLAAAGTWPTAVAEEQPITQDPGYQRFVEYAGSSARRQYCSGLHVHIGVASPGACMAALEDALPWLPVLLAVSANSPYFACQETGLASTRAEILALLPRSGAPPVFESFEAWERFAERLVELDLADDVMRIWWDIRPHPRFGTVELRAPDQPSRLDATLAFAALFQALVASGDGSGAGKFSSTTDPATRPPPADRGVYAQNRWAALRFGQTAALVHPSEERVVSAMGLLTELVERVHPALERFGTAGLVAALDGLAQADEQLEIGRRDGLRSLCETLVALT
jgi:carboxylate-amine ligase